MLKKTLIASLSSALLLSSFAHADTVKKEVKNEQTQQTQTQRYGFQDQINKFLDGEDNIQDYLDHRVKTLPFKEANTPEANKFVKEHYLVHNYFDFNYDFVCKNGKKPMISFRYMGRRSYNPLYPQNDLEFIIHDPKIPELNGKVFKSEGFSDNGDHIFVNPQDTRYTLSFSTPRRTKYVEKEVDNTTLQNDISVYYIHNNVEKPILEDCVDPYYNKAYDDSMVEFYKQFVIFKKYQNNLLLLKRTKHYIEEGKKEEKAKFAD